MSVSGVVLSVSPDWRGSSLAAATTTTTTVLSVVDAVDFDEEGGWLVIADEATPRQYLSVDEDADTVTLAAAVGAVFDAEDPVVVWDPTVEGGGARVREDIATVQLPDGEQPVMAIIKHEQVPLAGVYSLVGATVLLEDEDGDDETSDWFVMSVLGREANIDAAAVTTPHVKTYLAANLSIPHDADTIVTAWTVGSRNGIAAPNAAGEILIERTGLYRAEVFARWAANSTGGRKALVQAVSAAGVARELRSVVVGTAQGGQATVQISETYPLLAGERLRAGVAQYSTVSLNLDGSATGSLTSFSVIWEAP